jgi:hypothetical protein
MGQTIKVNYVTDLVATIDALGAADYRTNTIRLQSPTEIYPIPDDLIERVYLHEMLHMILNQLGEHELKQDEKLIDNIAGLLHQALQTNWVERS